MRVCVFGLVWFVLVYFGCECDGDIHKQLYAECCVVSGHGAYDEGDDGVGSSHDEITVVTPLEKKYLVCRVVCDTVSCWLACKRFRCVEVLLQPFYTKCDVNICKNMYANVVLLSSGMNMFPGVPERMTKELTASAPRKHMYANAVLPGGTNMFHEAYERMTKELTASAPRKNTYAIAVLSSARGRVFGVKLSAQ